MPQQTPLIGVTAFLRLLEFALPYRGRLAVALSSRCLSTAPARGHAYLIKPIFDEVLPTQPDAHAAIVALILGLYLLKGLGAYCPAT